MRDEAMEIERLRKRADRERRAREAAEAIAEQGTRLLYERQRQLQLLNAVADAANRTDSVDAVIQVALGQICAYTGWPVGHAYFVTEDTTHPLVPTSLWHPDDAEQFAAFRHVTENRRFRCGEGLPGRVLESGAPVWVADVTQSGNFPRARQAVEIGVRGAFAIPVRVGESVVAVLEFFTRESAGLGKAGLEVVAQVGTQVGRTFERKRANESLAAIHAHLQAEEGLRRARNEADRANKAKSEFLSSMSHELRTPLNAILGFAQLLELDETDQSKRQSLEQILNGGKHLIELINEILDVARIEAGRLELSPEEIDLAVLLADTVALMRPLAAQRNIQLASPAADALAHSVLADRQRLRQVLLNLVSNAIKYNRSGGSVTLACEKIGPQKMRIAVSDTGPGISAEQLPRLFTPFERLDATKTGIQGTGLGLALAKGFVEAMGGSIDVQSTPGQGTSFFVQLPMPAALRTEQMPPQ